MRVSTVQGYRYIPYTSCAKSTKNKVANLPSNQTVKNYTGFYNGYIPLSFRGMPYDTGYHPSSKITGKEALEHFKVFKLGNYLDIDGNPNKQFYREKRARNLEFLDKVKTNYDKRIFLYGYKKLTGFPDMEAVSKRIQDQFVNACNRAKYLLKGMYPSYRDCYSIVAAGFDGISSTAHNTALPGSDLDKAYIILKGNDNNSDNKEFVKNFKWRLWDSTDQRILSYNHDSVSFPEVYTQKQINALCESINNKVSAMDLHKKEPIPQTTLFEKLFMPIKYTPSKYDEYKKLTEKYNEDYVEANKFAIDLCKQYRAVGGWDIPLYVEDPYREDIYEVCYPLEAMIYGKTLIGNPIDVPLNQDAKDLINLSQIRAIKAKTEVKEKYKKRLSLSHDFYTWDIDTQYNFVKAMIKASCSDNTDFPEYFKSSEESRFNKILNVLGLETSNAN